MANINFHVDQKRKPNKQGFVPIKAIITFKSKNYCKNVGKVKLSDWNPLKQEVIKNRPKLPDNQHAETNKRLHELKNSCTQLFDNLPKNFQVTPVFVRNFLDGKEFIKNQSSDFNMCFLLYLEDCKKSKAPGTVKTHTAAYNFLIKYQDHIKANLSFQDINAVFYSKFWTYSFDTIGIQNNYFATTITILKTFLKWASNSSRKYNVNTEWIEALKATWTDNALVILTEDELIRLVNFTFDNKVLDRARDAFCLECYTGLRFSDIKDLKQINIQGANIVTFIKKVRKNATIPIIPQARKILDKYDHPVSIFKGMHNGNHNRSVRKCCEMAGIDQDVIKSKPIGNNTKTAIKKKYQLVTSHTARRTFVTLSYEMGMDIKMIQFIIGHKTPEMINRYLKISDEMKTSKMGEAWEKFNCPVQEQPTEIDQLKKEIEELKNYIAMMAKEK